MLPPILWKLYIKFYNIKKPYITPHLRGDGNGFLFGTRNKKEFFLSLLRSFHSDVSVSLEADEIRKRIDRGDIDPTFRFLFPLGKEYWIRPVSNAPEYFIKSVNQWIAKNHPGSESWYDFETAAIRLINWTAGYHLFADNSLMRERFREHFLQYIFLHASWFSQFNQNSFTNDAERIIVLTASQIAGVMFLNGRFGKSRHDRSIQQIDNNILRSGIDTTQNSFYQQLECYTISFLISRRQSVHRHPDALSKLHELYKTAAEANTIPEKPEEIFQLTQEEEMHMRERLLPVGAIMFNDPDIKKQYPHFSERALWLTGTEGFETFRTL